jgi:hypothetical protein
MEMRVCQDMNKMISRMLGAWEKIVTLDISVPCAERAIGRW